MLLATPERDESTEDFCTGHRAQALTHIKQALDH